MVVAPLYECNMSQRKQIHTPQQKEAVYSTLESIEGIEHGVNAPEGFMKTRDGAIIGYEDDTEDYEIVVRAETDTDHDALLMRYAQVEVTVELYHGHTKLDTVSIVGDLEFNLNGEEEVRPRRVDFWGEALGLIRHVHTYEEKVQETVDAMSERVQNK
jgi:hypothetical protein